MATMTEEESVLQEELANSYQAGTLKVSLKDLIDMGVMKHGDDQNFDLNSKTAPVGKLDKAIVLGPAFMALLAEVHPLAIERISVKYPNALLEGISEEMFKVIEGKLSNLPEDMSVKMNKADFQDIWALRPREDGDSLERMTKREHDRITWRKDREWEHGERQDDVENLLTEYAFLVSRRDRINIKSYIRDDWRYILLADHPINSSIRREFIESLSTMDEEGIWNTFFRVFRSFPELGKTLNEILSEFNDVERVEIIKQSPVFFQFMSNPSNVVFKEFINRTKATTIDLMFRKNAKRSGFLPDHLLRFWSEEVSLEWQDELVEKFRAANLPDQARHMYWITGKVSRKLMLERLQKTVLPKLKNLRAFFNNTKTTEDEKLAAILIDGRHIQYVQNPSNEMLLAAARQSFSLDRQIPGCGLKAGIPMNDEIIFAALTRDPNNILIFDDENYRHTYKDKMETYIGIVLNHLREGALLDIRAATFIMNMTSNLEVVGKLIKYYPEYLDEIKLKSLPCVKRCKTPESLNTLIQNVMDHSKKSVVLLDHFDSKSIANEMLVNIIRNNPLNIAFTHESCLSNRLIEIGLMTAGNALNVSQLRLLNHTKFNTSKELQLKAVSLNYDNFEILHENSKFSNDLKKYAALIYPDDVQKKFGYGNISDMICALYSKEVADYFIANRETLDTETLITEIEVMEQKNNQELSQLPTIGKVSNLNFIQNVNGGMNSGETFHMTEKTLETTAEKNGETTDAKKTGSMEQVLVFGKKVISWGVEKPTQVIVTVMMVTAAAGFIMNKIGVLPESVKPTVEAAQKNGAEYLGGIVKKVGVANASDRQKLIGKYIDITDQYRVAKIAKNEDMKRLSIARMESLRKNMNDLYNEDPIAFLESIDGMKDKCLSDCQTFILQLVKDQKKDISGLLKDNIKGDIYSERSFNHGKG